MAFAKKGDLAAFEYVTLIFYLRPGHQHKLYNYIYADDNSRKAYPAELKTLYDKAIAANNGRGWTAHDHVESIEMWEKRYQNKETKSFFGQVGDLLK